ncbi:MAG TPA: 50S ribosomal protein L15 [Candidatus Limadaptatus stercoripullorum]|uniref:Large ribosomal subunit protein uL15 n=1 Tax=Candidatus Limadaptatus stercoripullorum TaxID=2840846 RepID=A0A9D1SW46_9FIRM|nr:50S ribosomal protein L15 [Candidatus Limadaptatus stercoripullorum]
MYIHDMKGAEGAKTSPKRVGRGIGSGTGKTSTRGHKGQWARSGGGVRPNFEGGQMPLTRRIPKKGFNNKRFAHAYTVVNLDVFNAFEDGAVVGIDELVAAGLVKVVEPYGLKVLAGGELEKKVTVRANKFSAAAEAKIKKAGGNAEVL